MGILLLDTICTLGKSWAVSICVMHILCEIFGIFFDVVPASLIWLMLLVVELHPAIIEISEEGEE